MPKVSDLGPVPGPRVGVRLLVVDSLLPEPTKGANGRSHSPDTSAAGETPGSELRKQVLYEYQIIANEEIINPYREIS
ncbi:hypothetical protein J6590_013530 [Homalodisca vitripennis]|nr:hypothetical protein J6590_013530 [Homalodisca vitripennis]